MAITVHHQVNIYQPSQTYTHFIWPSRIRWDNAIEKPIEGDPTSGQVPGTDWMYRTMNPSGGSGYVTDHITTLENITVGDVRLPVETDEYSLPTRGFGVWTLPSESGEITTKYISGSLRFRFKNAAQSISDGSYYDLIATISNGVVSSRSIESRFVPILTLNGNGFHFHGMAGPVPGDVFAKQTIDGVTYNVLSNEADVGDFRPGCKATLKLQIVNPDTGTLVSGATFPFPFKDVDVTRDFTENTNPYIGGEYVESIRLDSDITDVYVTSRGTLPDGTTTFNTELAYGTHSSYYNLSSVNSIPDGSRVFHGVPDAVDDTRCDMVVMFKNGGAITWTGTQCGTSMKGEGVAVELKYDANGGTGGPESETFPSGQHKISTTEPIKSVRLTYDANSSPDYADTPAPFYGTTDEYTRSRNLNVTFRGWARTKTRADQGQVDYVPGTFYEFTQNTTIYAVYDSGVAIGTLPIAAKSTGNITPRDRYRLDVDTPWTTTRNGSVGVTASTTINKNTTIYARWEYKIIVDSDEGELWARRESDGQITPLGQGGGVVREDERWKKHGSEILLDYIVFSISSIPTGYNKDPSATSGQGSISAYGTRSEVVYSAKDNQPVTYYVAWKPRTYKVTFKDGYSNPGEDIIKVVSNIPYGGSVAEVNVPVPGNIYNGKKFKKPGPYQFLKWGASYQNITKDTICEAIWKFCVIWIVIEDSQGRRWVPYTPDPSEPDNQ